MLGLANHRGATRGQQAAAADLALAAGLAGLGGQGMVPIMLYNTRKESKLFFQKNFPAQADGDPPRLRLFTEQMWKQFQRKLQSLGLSPKPKRSEGEGDKPKRPARTPSALSWELVWRRRG
jgi:hypothetical protein